MKIDSALYKWVMAQPISVRHREYRKLLAYYVTRLPQAQKDDILSRRYDIMEAEGVWHDFNRGVLSRLGFTAREVEMLCDKRLNSPGMRNVIKMRVEYGR